VPHRFIAARALLAVVVAALPSSSPCLV